MNKSHLMTFALLLAALVFFSPSCTHPPTGPEQVIGRTFQAPKGKALICVYRPRRMLGLWVPRPVYINRQHVASLSSGSFVALPVDPGNLVLQAATQALIDTPEYRAAYPDIEVKLKAGQSIFIHQTVHGFAPNQQSSVMMLQTGGAPVPLSISSGLPPFSAEIVSTETGRSACSGLKQIGAEPLNASTSQ